MHAYMHAYMRAYIYYKERRNKEKRVWWEGVDQGQNFYICV